MEPREEFKVVVVKLRWPLKLEMQPTAPDHVPNFNVNVNLTVREQSDSALLLYLYPSNLCLVSNSYKQLLLTPPPHFRRPRPYYFHDKNKSQFHRSCVWGSLDTMRWLGDAPAGQARIETRVFFVTALLL